TVQTGRIVIFSGGQIQPAPFLDISQLVSCCVERGLLGIAFHPRYSENRFFFVDYTNTAGDTVIARFQASAGNPNAADPASRVTLLTVTQPFPNHNGGQLQFGPDGYLYIGMGDGGSANDPMCNAQRDDTLLGKLLRIDVNQNVSSPPFYGIPSSNPFAGPGGPLDEIWAKGLRNPWRFSFRRAPDHGARGPGAPGGVGCPAGGGRRGGDLGLEGQGGAAVRRGRQLGLPRGRASLQLAFVPTAALRVPARRRNLQRHRHRRLRLP